MTNKQKTNWDDIGIAIWFACLGIVLIIGAWRGEL